ncbi:formylglycine-generating enzyme family protein [Roseivirga echinicomitans]
MRFLLRTGLILICCFSSLFIGAKQLVQNQFSKYEQKIAGAELVIPMVPITGGQFKLGSPANEVGRNEDEGPVHQVELGDFWMSSHEITWDLFELFLYREFDQELSEGTREVDIQIDAVSGATMPYVNFNKPGYPLINVTQYAAATFCKWLSAKTGHFYRLPTEAEWEYAARTNSEKAFPFDSNAIDDFAWYKGNSGESLQKGGLKKPNAWGLYDMYGNASEWVLDSYSADYYKEIEGAKNPVLITDQLYPRVVKGGSYKDEINKLRPAARDFSDKSWKKRDPQIPKSLWWLTDATHVGFRIVRPKITPPKSEWEKYWGKPIKEY